MIRTLFLVGLLLLGGPAYAQITVPAEIERDKISTATMTAVIPEGAEIKGGWSCPTADVKPTAEYTSVYIAGPPGSHVLSFAGYWVLLGPEITVTDVNGVDQTFQPHLGDGPLNFSAPFKVIGKDDDDGDDDDDGGDDPDPNPTKGPWKIVLFHDLSQLDNLPSQQRLLLSSLKIRKDLQTLGHVFLEVVEAQALRGGSVPERIKAFADSVSGDPLPRIAIMPLSGQQVVYDYPLPANYTDLAKLLDNPPEVK